MSKFSSHSFSVASGSDVVKCLQDFTTGQNLRAAFVLQCVGEICRATLRMADAKKAFEPVKEICNHAKIEALVGTLSGNNGHLHLLLSSRDGERIGGHVFGPLVASSTVEVAIGECEDLLFTRAHDQRTGYPELVVIDRDYANLEGNLVLNSSRKTHVARYNDSTIKAYTFRLVPGEDIFDGLKDFVSKNNLTAPFIMTCVGSMTKAVLNVDHKMITMEGHYEIVCLVGTPSNLTISLADKRGQVTTGHVLGQLIVFTTAELVIGDRISSE